MLRKNGKTARRLKKLRFALTRPKVAENSGITLPLDYPEISPQLRRALFLDPYEANELAIISKKLAPDDIVLELGAGIGFISTYCAKKIGSDRVHAYEANPTMEGVIRHTYRLNGVTPDLRIGALGPHEGELEFFLEAQYISSSAIRRSDAARAVRVPMESANAVIARLQPTFLICDIEGAEGDLFEGLEFGSIRKICIELHPHIVGNDRLNALVRHLMEEGFLCDFSLVQRNVYYFERKND